MQISWKNSKTPIWMNKNEEYQKFFKQFKRNFSMVSKERKEILINMWFDNFISFLKENNIEINNFDFKKFFKYFYWKTPEEIKKRLYIEKYSYWFSTLSEKKKNFIMQYSFKEIDAFKEKTKLELFLQWFILEKTSQYKNFENWNIIFDCGHQTIFRQLIIWRIERNFPVVCLECFKKSDPFSSKEKELVNFIKTFYKWKIIENERKILKTRELDIFLPELNIAIEFNGNYFHNEDKEIMLLKYQKCREKWIQLIVVWEDFWKTKKEIVKNKLKNILQPQQIQWTHIEIKEIDKEIASHFLKKNCLFWENSSHKYLWAFYHNQLIWASWLYFKKHYCEMKNFSYIQNQKDCLEWFVSFIKNNLNFKNIVIFSNNEWEDGNFYKEVWFHFLKETKQNFYYVLNFRRFHREELNKKLLLKMFPEYKKINKTKNEIISNEWFLKNYDLWHTIFSIWNETNIDNSFYEAKRDIKTIKNKFETERKKFKEYFWHWFFTIKEPYKTQIIQYWFDKIIKEMEEKNIHQLFLFWKLKQTNWFEAKKFRKAYWCCFTRLPIDIKKKLEEMWFETTKKLIKKFNIKEKESWFLKKVVYLENRSEYQKSYDEIYWVYKEQLSLMLKEKIDFLVNLWLEKIEEENKILQLKLKNLYPILIEKDEIKKEKLRFIAYYGRFFSTLWKQKKDYLLKIWFKKAVEKFPERKSSMKNLINLD